MVVRMKFGVKRLHAQGVLRDTAVEAPPIRWPLPYAHGVIGQLDKEWCGADEGQRRGGGRC